MAIVLKLVYGLSLFLLLCLPVNRAFSQTNMEFVFPAPFQRLCAPVKLYSYALTSFTGCVSSAFAGDLKTVESNNILKDANVNPSNDADFVQVINPGAVVEFSSLGVGKWVFSSGSSLRGTNSVGINHDGEILCACNFPDHEAVMILPKGVSAEGLINVYYGTQYVFGDYRAETELHNGAYQKIFSAARIFGTTKILDFGETFLLGTIMPDAETIIDRGGVLRIANSGRIEGRLDINGGMVFAYDHSYIKELKVTDGGMFYALPNSAPAEVVIGDIVIDDKGQMEMKTGTVNSLSALSGKVVFSEPGVFDNTLAPCVNGLFFVGNDAKLVLSGSVSPLALNSDSMLEVDGGEIIFEPYAWQTSSVIRKLEGHGKINFGYSILKNELMSSQRHKPLPFTELTIISGSGEFELGVFTYEHEKNKQQNHASSPSSLPDEFVLIKDEKGDLKFDMPGPVQIGGRTYHLEERGSAPKLWLLKAGVLASS